MAMREPEVTLGVRMMLARRQAGKEQAEMALEIGVSRGLVSRWELDNSNPRVEQLTKWAEITETPVMWLINGLNENGLSRSFSAWQPELPFDSELPLSLATVA